MASSNIKLFDENKGNMLNDTEFNISTQRLNGLQTGVASSQLQNKAMYQASLVAYAIAQLMLANGKNANDTDAVSTFVNNLLASIVQKVADKASANDVANQVAGKWIDAKQLGKLKTDIADNYLSLLGGTMLGDLILHSDPTQSLQAATKQYVDGFGKVFVEEREFSAGDTEDKAAQIVVPFKPKFWILPKRQKESLPTEVTSILPLPNLSNTYELYVLGYSGGNTSLNIKFDNGIFYFYGVNQNPYFRKTKYQYGFLG